MAATDRPTRAQRAILARLAGGAIIQIRVNGYLLTGDGGPDRVVTDATMTKLRRSGWVWSGPDRPSLVITEMGRKLVSGGDAKKT
jgi:hypothetical protein